MDKDCGTSCGRYADFNQRSNKTAVCYNFVLVAFF